MKKTLLLLTLCAILVLGCACSNIDTTDGEQAAPSNEKGLQDSVQNTPQQKPMQPEPILDGSMVQYIRTDGYHDDSEYPQTVVIRSQQELHDYYTANKYDYDLWNDWDSSVSFIDAAQKYDEAFFEDNALLLVLMQEGSGSNRHRVMDIQKHDDTVTVEVDRLLPEPFTCDMAMWHIIIEQPKGDLEGQSIKINVNDVPMERLPHEQPEHKITFSSGEETIIPYEVMKWSEIYDAETGKGVSADFMHVTLTDLTNELPVLTVLDDLSVFIADNGQRDGNVVLYDTQFNELDTFHDLSVSVLMQHRPGTYYVSLDVKWVGDYIEAAQANNGYGAQYFVKLILPEEGYSHANDVPMGERGKRKVIFTSDEVTVAPVEQLMSSIVYDTETGKCVEIEASHDPIEQHTDLIPELTVGKNLEMHFPLNYRREIREFVLCDEQWNVLETLDDLNAGVLMRHGEGTYYVRLDVKWREDYVDVVQDHNRSHATYYIKLNLPDEEYGLAKQLEEIGGFDTTALQKAEVYMINSAKDGGIEPISISDGTKGLERLLSLMRKTETQEEHLAPDSAGWSQVIRLYDDESRIMTIKVGNDGLYISTDGKHYTISAPPWLFEQMVEAIADRRVMPMEEATSFAWEAIKQRNEYELFTDGSETKTTARLKDGYKWIVTYHIQYSNGETKELSVTIENHHITQFDESD